MKSINRVATDDYQFVQSANLKRLLTRVVGLGNHLEDFFDVFSACLSITHWSDKVVRFIFNYRITGADNPASVPQECLSRDSLSAEQPGDEPDHRLRISFHNNGY